VVATVADSVELAGVDCVVVSGIGVVVGGVDGIGVVGGGIGVDVGDGGFVVDVREFKHSEYEQQQMRETEVSDASQSNGADAV
jgi:hypothetical protein